ncbi:MAG: CHAT domain-containing protein [Chloroflexota bacterium]
MNPYTSRAMIRDPQAFFGRVAELHELYTRLRNSQSCSLVGPRRVGKSSLLQHLVQPGTYTAHLPEAERYVFAFVDLQELAGLGPEDFFQVAVERLKRAGAGRLQADVQQDGTQAGFRRFLSRTTDQEMRLVLCCDEFEMLSQNPHFDAHFFAYLRALCSNYNLALLTSSRASLFDLCHQGDLQSSQFWNIFVELALGLMQPDEALDLASQPFERAGFSLSAELQKIALDLGGCHPFFLQIACYHLFEALQIADGLPDLERVEACFFDESRPHFTYAWEQLNAEQQAALRSLGQGQVPSLPANLFRDLSRQALISGSPAAPALASPAWGKFISSLGPAPGAVPVPQAPSVQLTSPPVTQPAPAAPRPHFQQADVRYMDFDLLFEKSGGKYRARVLNSPSGQAAADFSLPFSDLELDNFYLRLGLPRTDVRRVGSPGMEAARAFGQRLFESTFRDEIYNCLNRSLDEASQQASGLRIRLWMADVPELADLPWEYLYSPSANRFLNLSLESPIVRYLELSERLRPMRVKPPLKILAMISSPSDYPPLDVAREWQNLKNALAGLEQSGLVQVERLERASLAVLLARLRRDSYHIFHYIGHGGFDAHSRDGVLMLEDETGRGRQVGSQHLGMLLHDEHFVLAVLNACEAARSARDDPFSGTAQSLVQQGIPAVIAMQFAISDQAAITFSLEFYTALAEGYPVDAALGHARKNIFAACSDVEWGTPVLYLRSKDGFIFDLQET